MTDKTVTRKADHIQIVLEKDVTAKERVLAINNLVVPCTLSHPGPKIKKQEVRAYLVPHYF